MNHLPDSPYLQTAQQLAEAHRAADPFTTLVLLDPDPNEQEIRLLEVSKAAATSGELYPFGFPARPELGIPYPSVVLLLSPEEWTDVQNDRLPLPSGWTRDRLREV